ncbi:MAG: hypothetical protein II794_06710 [Oscillospiraceae bacterium]|nr:hypothetical protein [Oscillospiraceae bacterium]
MNGNKLLCTLEQIDDKYILEALPENAKPIKSFHRRRVIALALSAAAILALAIIGSVLLRPEAAIPDAGTLPAPSVRQTENAGTEYVPPEKEPYEPLPAEPGTYKRYALALASYPEQYPSVYSDLSNGPVVFDQQASALFSKQNKDRWELGRNTVQPKEFTSATVSAFLKGAGTKNRVYSPLNVYFALCMLAESGSGATRQQVLDLLGADSIEALRENAGKLWLSNYQNDGMTSSILASSIWVDEALAKNGQYNEKTAQLLADSYYASLFSGEMGSEQYNEALRSWLNENTGRELGEYSSRESFDKNTVFALATTIFYEQRWQTVFKKENNTKDTFKGAGGNQTVEFMNDTDLTGEYYWGEKFGAAKKETGDAYSALWFMLPDEGVTLDELLSDPEALAFITGYRPNRRDVKLNLTVPKFDVSSNMELSDELQILGVKDAFSDKADFSSLINFSAAVNKVSHSARFAIDESGVTGAAYTVIKLYSGYPPENPELDFVLDRPFIFFQESDTGSVLFVGIVNNI